MRSLPALGLVALLFAFTMKSSVSANGHGSIAWMPWLITQLRDVPTREWSRSHPGFWDQAIEGSSALKVALDRLVGDEIATGCLYTDIKDFYDYLCPVETLKAALDLGFPAPIAVLAFSAYGGARVLQGPDGCSRPLQAARGIITGALCSRLPTQSLLWSKQENGLMTSFSPSLG